MTVTDLVMLITAAFQFPAAILEFVKLLKTTPEEQHEALLKAIQSEKDKLNQTGRPTWPH